MSAGHLIKVYAIAGLLSGLAGVVTSARAISGQAGMGVMYELDAIAAAVIGGTSLSGGVGRITGTVIGAIILGVMTSGFTFLRVDAYYQEIVKGSIIVAAVVVDQYRQAQAQESLADRTRSAGPGTCLAKTQAPALLTSPARWARSNSLSYLAIGRWS